eukprot:c9466_g2_i1.p1 GENE.c9466_g2_i1~~c9466_g2_i1.p1  ORF type:complete len:566 (-),score=129.81 c9466_g2_i1:87-1679(-)
MTATVNAQLNDAFRAIINDESLRFLGFLNDKFEARRQELLATRKERAGGYDAGKLPIFLPETAHIRNSDWRCADIPEDLKDRRVEVTGPVDRKMVINALNCGALTYMADFEDSTCPTLFNLVDGQINLKDAIRKNISFTDPASGKSYRLKDKVATLLVRPRGWHLNENHITFNGKPMSGSLFDFGLFFFHNARELVNRGSAPYFYLPKMQSYLEARLWNDVFIASQAYCNIPRGTIRATVLIETLPAAFQMDEILYELREHSSGLNCGRWDYIFSYIKVVRAHPQYVLPDRSQVSMTSPFMDAYVKLLIRTCHRRGTFAMGGMAAQIPIKNDAAKNDVAMEAVRKDKLREVRAGHDGTWVAHPALVSIAKDVFDAEMKGPNQIYYIPEAGRDVTQEQLLSPSTGSISVEGVRENISVGIAYTEAWLRGIGCIPYMNKMEDAATAEISRVQVWQWLHHGCKCVDGTAITKDLVRGIVAEESRKLAQSVGPSNKAHTAAAIMEQLITSDTLPEFLTTVAYPHVVASATSARL